MKDGPKDSTSGDAADDGNANMSAVNNEAPF